MFAIQQHRVLTPARGRPAVRGPRVRAVPLICSLWLAASCVAAQSPADEAVGDAPALRFAWSVPGSATVEETAYKDDVTTVVRYRIVARPHASGDILIEQTDMELLTFNGEDPAVALGIMHGPVLAMAANAPAMRVDLDGHFVDVVDLEATIDRMVELLVRDLTVLDPPMVRDMIAAARTPRVMKLTADATRARWNNWVGHWVGIPLESQSWSYEEPGNDVEGMKTLRSSALVERLSPEGEPDTTRLRMTTIWEGEPQAADDEAGADAQVLPIASRDQGATPFSVEVVNSVDATFDPATLQPMHVTTTVETVVRSGEDMRRDSQRNEYRFTWDRHEPVAGSP